MKNFKDWLYKEYQTGIPTHVTNTLLKEGIPEKWIVPASMIIHHLSEMPWYTQKQMLEDT